VEAPLSTMKVPSSLSSRCNKMSKPPELNAAVAHERQVFGAQLSVLREVWFTGSLSMQWISWP